MLIRRFTENEYDMVKQAAELFYATVHSVNARDYTDEQLNAWADGMVDMEEWNRSFSAHYTLLAEEEGILLGFGDLDGDYLDRLYVHKDHQGEGIGSAITGGLETYAVLHGAGKLVVHASLTAKSFFEKRGYITVKEQLVKRRGVFLANFVMERRFEGINR